MAVLLHVSLVLFTGGNRLDLGLRLDPQDALRGLSERALRGSYCLGFGLKYDQESVLSTGMATWSLAAALAPLIFKDFPPGSKEKK